MTDLVKIVANLGPKEKETLAEIALAMARCKQSSWTGATIWSIHYTQGAVGDATEETKRSLFRGRKVRSRGVRT